MDRFDMRLRWRFGLSVKKLHSQSTAVSCRKIWRHRCLLCSDVRSESCKGPTSTGDSYYTGLRSILHYHQSSQKLSLWFPMKNYKNLYARPALTKKLPIFIKHGKSILHYHQSSQKLSLWFPMKNTKNLYAQACCDQKTSHLHWAWKVITILPLDLTDTFSVVSNEKL